MASEWDEALYGLGLIPPEEEGASVQAAGVPSVQGTRNFLFAPLPDTGPATALHSLATSIGPSPGTVANTFLATMGAPPAAKGFLAGSDEALAQIEQLLASLPKKPVGISPSGTEIPIPPAPASAAKDYSGVQPINIWKIADPKWIPVGHPVQAGEGGPIGTFKGVSPGGTTLVDWKAPTAAKAPPSQDYIANLASLWHNGEPLPGQTSGSPWDINTNVLPQYGIAPKDFWETVHKNTMNPQQVAKTWANAQPAQVDKGASFGLSDAEIEKQLAANPGASIFDLAGVSGPSSPYKPIQSTETTEQFGSLGKFPKEVPYAPPEQAVAQGYVTPALHGTRLGEQRWAAPVAGPYGHLSMEDIGGFGAAHSAGKDALRLPEDELGVHFGTPEQAHHFTSNVLGAGYLPRTYPTVLQTGRSLELPDMGTWQLPRINTALDRLHAGEGYGLTEGGFRVANPEAHVGEFPSHERADFESIQEMRDYLRSKGYDSVNYINKVEGRGQRSYIMFKPSPEEPQFVSGVRSRFAQFDPSKLARPELAAGLAGAIAAPVLFDEQNRPFFLTK